MLSRILRMFCAATLGLGFAATAMAQDASQEPEEVPGVTREFVDWAVRCGMEDAPGNGCIMYQRIVSKESGQPVFAWLIEKPDDKVYAVLRMPLGLDLQKGVRITVDEEKSRRLPYRTCLPQACETRVVMTGTLLEEMRAGALVDIEMYGLEGDAFNIELSLQGFTKALEALETGF